MAALQHRSDRKERPYTVRWREAGRHRRRSFRLKSEARSWLAEAQRIEDATRAGTYVPPPRRVDSPTVADQLERWMATRGHLSSATRSRHRSAFNRWILPEIGRLRIVDVRADDLDTILARITAAGRGADTRINVYQALNQMLDHAVSVGLLQTNPCRAVVAGTSRRKRRVRPFTRIELDQLVEHLDAPHDLFVMVMAFTGLRWGEMAALTGGQVDVASGIIVVDRALKADRTIGPPKTFANRSVHMADSIRHPVHDHISHHRLGPNDLLWSSNGTPLWKDNWRKRVWYPALAAAGLERRVPYDLRHTCASWLIAKGANPKDVMEWLGHADLRTTMERYAHLFPGRKAELAALLG